MLIISLYVALQLEGCQPLTNPDDNAEVEEIAKSDERVIQLVKERYGVTMDQVIVDPWCVWHVFWMAFILLAWMGSCLVLCCVKQVHQSITGSHISAACDDLQ